MSEARHPPKANRGPAAAAANRRALIDAAREVFAERGFTVPFSAIARRAGVGQAILYRHFADKTALAAAIFDENLAALEREELGLRAFLERIAGQARVSAAMLEALIVRRSAAAVELDARLHGVIAAVLERGRATGDVDASVTVDDVAAATSMIAFHVAAAREDDAATRAIGLIERGLLPRR